jgi:alpha-1,2-mannosyltransferase
LIVFQYVLFAGYSRIADAVVFPTSALPRAPHAYSSQSMGTTSATQRLTDIARPRSWWLPAVSATLTVVGFSVICGVRTEIDLGVYLMGGAHIFSTNLYHVRYLPNNLGFTYPPFAALLFTPFTRLPIRLNQVVFAWLSLAALFGLVATCLRATCPTLEKRVLLWWALVLMAPAVALAPMRETLMFGQVNLILSLAVVADMTLDLRIPKGILVGLAAAVKLTPLILIPYLILTRRPRAACFALGSFAAAAAVAAAVSPHDSWLYWSHDAWSPGRAGSVAFVGNQGALGVIARLVRHSFTTLPTFTIVIGVGAIGMTVATLLHRRSSVLLGFVVMQATECLASPISWDHHFVWVILLIAWLALAPDRPTHGWQWAAVVAVIFWAAPLWWVPTAKYAGQGLWIPLADCFFLVTVATVAGASVRVARSRWRDREVTTTSGAFPTKGPLTRFSGS